ncbi:MAG TPA: exosortase F system-associated protein [Flavobacteriaceae bacterium]|nr:exosortase F system-associated protein [Flavobacteriaceae bacterium]
MKFFSKIIIIGFLFVLLACIRFFETELFYDPLISFYKGKYLTQEPPVFEEWKLIMHTIFRYGLNTFFSLLILWAAFRKKNILKFAGLIYGLAFFIFCVIFGYLLFNMKPENYMALFYVRRFLIQPLFILLLLPAFYYQQNLKK